ncbi:MAG: hypothetical protein QM757_12155 [Paludibaculum sp.]
MLNITKRITIAASVFAVALSTLSAAPASDPEQKPAETKAVQATPKAATGAPAQAAPKSAGGVLVFKDPVTGKLRAPEPGEVDSLLKSGQRSIQGVAAPTAQPFRSPAGAGIGLKVGEESMSYTVVTRGPDGKLKESCVTGEKAATAKVSAAPTASPKEVLDEK